MAVDDTAYRNPSVALVQGGRLKISEALKVGSHLLEADSEERLLTLTLIECLSKFSTMWWQLDRLDSTCWVPIRA